MLLPGVGGRRDLAQDRRRGARPRPRDDREPAPPPGCGIIVRTAAGFDEDHGELDRDLAYLHAALGEHQAKRRDQARRRRSSTASTTSCCATSATTSRPTSTRSSSTTRTSTSARRTSSTTSCPGRSTCCTSTRATSRSSRASGSRRQIESIYKRRVALKSGGSIVIDGTEALTAIDVNSGGSMRGTSQEETAHKTNLEAAREVARQLRLRDLGGIIVVDFIDMRMQSHISDVERALREAMRPEKARHDVGRISRLGLLEISRQRLRPAAVASSYTACPMCEGHGSVRTPESAALGTLAEDPPSHRRGRHRADERDAAARRRDVSLESEARRPRDARTPLLGADQDRRQRQADAAPERDRDPHA